MNEKGLTKKEAENNLKKFGLNEIKDLSKTNPIKILFRQIKNNFIIYLLFLSVIISFSVGKSITAYTLIFVIIMVVGIGFIQEYRSEKAINALKSMLTPISIVIRDGKEQEIESKYLVPGDILILKNGEKIPADCLILEEKELLVNESILTGESKEIQKRAKKQFNEKNISDENLLFMGTYIVNGKAIAKVINTGMNTKFGKIAGMISKTEKELPLQKKVNKIAKYMAILSLTISFLTGFMMIFRAEQINKEVLINVLILVIALSVSAFPEGFPVVLITALSSGAYKMAKLNAIVNRMSIIETLGETTVICSDKTGTITKGEMTVKKIFSNNKLYDVSGIGYELKGDLFYNNKKIDLKRENLSPHLFNDFLLCNDAKLENKNNNIKTSGSPTELSLVILAAKLGLYQENILSKRIEEIPFNSERKMMSVLCKINNEQFVYSKGAFEYLIKKCKYIERDGKIRILTEKDKIDLLKINTLMAKDSFRTLAFAYKKANSYFKNKNDLEKDLIFLGLVGMEDPPREEVKKSILQCLKAGISVKMITGDDKETALSIAKQIGLKGKILTGKEIDNLDDNELSKIINSIAIFARVNPEHKLRIIKSLKENGEIVTMTGDGVNDAPALKEAHIGVAMGKNGTDVSRSVADLTLKDDNFNTLVLAVKEGRTIFKNIRKFVSYQLSCNIAELSILFLGVLLSPLLGWEIPLLLALQILFMNLVTDNLPAITLSLNPSSNDIILDKPRKNSEILNKNLLFLLMFNGLLMTSFVLLSYFFSFNILKNNVDYSRTVALLTLIFLEIVSAFNFRSFKKGVLKRSIFINPYLFYSSLISLILTFLIIYTPLNKIFNTVPLKFEGFLIAIAFSFVLILIFDLFKIINNKKKFFDFEK